MGRSTWRRLLRNAPVLLLIAVAFVHQLNVRANDLAPERGGGFGMFAFVDAASHRAIHLTLSSASESWTLDLADHLAELKLTAAEAEAAAALPSYETLRELGARVLAARWQRTGETLSVARPGTGDLVGLDRVTVTVVGIEFDQEETALRRAIVRQLKVAA